MQALAIYYLHNQKILHCDLTPQNIFLRYERIQLGGFGIAKMFDSTQDIETRCIGTPYYTAPEIFKSKPYSYKSDIWSLGCILY
jgi:serine/threonine protein kinase